LGFGTGQNGEKFDISGVVEKILEYWRISGV